MKIFAMTLCLMMLACILASGVMAQNEPSERETWLIKATPAAAEQKVGDFLAHKKPGSLMLTMDAKGELQMGEPTYASANFGPNGADLQLQHLETEMDELKEDIAIQTKMIEEIRKKLNTPSGSK